MVSYLMLSSSIVAAAVAAQSNLTFPTPTLSNGTSYTSTSFDPGLAATQMVQMDFSNERLAFLWNQVGPVATGLLNSTISPTPEPTAFARPGILHPQIPTYQPSLGNYTLPLDFEWGVASSAYQIEGATKDEGKGPSIWDLLSHRVPNQVADNTTGDISSEHYYYYKQDFARLKALGIKRFAFSISWPRIFPFGKGPINEAGVKHYDDVIVSLLEHGIEPSITLFHWDTPLALFNEYGAWSDRQIVDDFYNYATYMIQRYDAYVKTWFTINEPQYCNWQYSYYPAGKYYPVYNNISTPLQARFTCGHYTLLAHAKVAKWYHNEFKGKARITMKHSGNYYLPVSNNASNLESAQRNYDFALGWFNHGPWIDGDYPQTLKDTLGSILPNFTAEEKAMINGSCDFFAIDGYTSYYAFGLANITACLTNSSYPDYPECAGSSQISPSDGFPIGPQADAGANWLSSTPVGIRQFLKHITQELFPRVPDIQVTEFGFAEPFESSLTSLQTILWDLRRADYVQSYLDNILAARVIDGVNVTGAWAWSWIDNFEWGSGYSTRFGLQYVNYTDLTRTPKASFFTFLDWVAQHTTDGKGNETSAGQHR